MYYFADTQVKLNRAYVPSVAGFAGLPFSAFLLILYTT